MFFITLFLTLVCLNLNQANGLNLTLGECGRSLLKVNREWFIVGGTNAASGEFPWQIILIRDYIDGSNGQMMREMCGGTIIASQWVLTAAHCVMKSSDTSQYKIILGVIDIQTNGSTARRANVDKIIHHENFDKISVVNDIALIKIKDSIDFNGEHKFLGAVCLANSTTYLTSNCIATGFGYKSKSGPTSNTLQKVLEPVISGNQCKSIHKTFDERTNICAGGTAYGGTGTCMGDSGGPLQCKASDGRYYQVGITSYGIPCAKPNLPDVFTRVAAFTDWIHTTIRNN